MREGYEGFEKEIKGKRIAVVGMGISNRPVPSVLAKAGASVIRCFDEKYSEDVALQIEQLRKEGYDADYYAGADYLAQIGSGYDFVFRTPGLRPDTYELVKAGKLTSEMEMFLRYCPAKIYGVTGSDGKTTTTTLISVMLGYFTGKSGGKVYLGGNIGKPLLSELENIKENDRICVELSSFQLMNMEIGTDVAVITNVSPNHLNYHKDYNEYLDAKANILRFRDGKGVCVLNRGNEDSGRYFNTQGEIRTFSTKCLPSGNEKSAFEKDGFICFGTEESFVKLVKTDDIFIKGDFNRENFMAAYCAVADEVTPSEFKETAETFKGVRHRMEFVRNFRGVNYYNSSIDSSPNRTINALSIYDKKIILIAGGKDKGISYDSLGPTLHDKVKAMILTGPTAKLIEKSARDEFERRNEEYNIPSFHCSTYEEAVLKASMTAEAGDNVILSPASTSFDMFKNFEERGDTFRKLVNEL